MLFFLIFLLGLGIPFFFMKSRIIWLKWLPGLVLLGAAIMMGLKILFFPAPEMAVLGEIVYAMLLGLAAFGSFAGAVAVQIVLKRKRS